METGEVLKEIGFSEYEIKVYTTLLSNQKMGAKEIYQKKQGFHKQKFIKLVNYPALMMGLPAS